MSEHESRDVTDPDPHTLILSSQDDSERKGRRQAAYMVIRRKSLSVGFLDPITLSNHSVCIIQQGIGFQIDGLISTREK
jgi:hypothetical protein